MLYDPRPPRRKPTHDAKNPPPRPITDGQPAGEMIRNPPRQEPVTKQRKGRRVA